MCKITVLSTMHAPVGSIVHFFDHVSLVPQWTKPILLGNFTWFFSPAYVEPSLLDSPFKLTSGIHVAIKNLICMDMKMEGFEWEHHL